MALKSYERFSAEDDYPDLSNHNNHMSQRLTKELYTKLRRKATPNGFTLDKAIQTGVDNPGEINARCFKKLQCSPNVLLSYEISQLFA